MNEIWKDIPGFERRYQVSTQGRVKSLGRKVIAVRCSGKTFYRKVPERILKPGRYSKSGHLSVVLERGKSGFPVHQLVMKSFIGWPPSGCEVLHINGNPSDNRLSNLRYGTRTENILDVYYQGKAWRSLTIEEVEEIRFGLCCGIRVTELARMYGVSASSISKIKRGKSYSWL